MRTVFADTDYWIARVHARDPWAEAARQAREALGDVRLLTTDGVLTEFLTGLRHGEYLRTLAAKAVRAILDDPNVKVVPQTRDSFLKGLELYEQRLDKEYSLTDCISMNAMRAEGVTEVLTNDGHFTQEGFTVLMTKE
jgi:predicted nucleic acid-binding protein